MSPKPSSTSKDIGKILERVPPGRVITVGALSAWFGLSEPALLGALKRLSSGAGDWVPWHRVVMNGGALGRFGPRAEHLARLRSEGVVVAPAGIVQEMQRAAVRDVAALPAAHSPAMCEQAQVAANSNPPAPSRSRGRLGAPKSSV